MRTSTNLVGVLVNARAGGVAARGELTGLLRTMVGTDGLVEVTDDLSLLPDAAHRLVAERPQVFALCGGDGTFSCGLGALEAAAREVGWELPPILALPAGTMSTVLRGIGERRRPLAALEQTLHQLRDGVPLRWRRHPMMHINDRPGFIFGAVLISRLLEVYYEAGGEGPAGAWKLVPKFVNRALSKGSGKDPVFQPTRATVVVDGMEIASRELSLILAGTICDVAVGMRILYRARERDDRFHVVAAQGPPTEMVLSMVRAFRARNMRFTNMFDGLGERMVVEFEKEETYIHDGELRRARRVVVNQMGNVRIVY